MRHAFNPSIGEAEADGPLGLRLAWSTWQKKKRRGQRGLGTAEAHREDDEAYCEQLGSFQPSVSPVLLHQGHQAGADHLTFL